MNRYPPSLRVVESMAASTRNPKYVRLVEATRGRAQIEKGVARLAKNASIDDAIACLEHQIALMRAQCPQQQREQS